LLAKEDLVVSGLDVCGLVFDAVDPRSRLVPSLAEGGPARKGDVLGRVEGPARGLLQAERVALNFLQRLSGVATLTRRFVEAVAGTGARIRDTRKTTLLLLDNFTPEDVRVAVRMVASRVPVEVSGGVTLATVRAYAEAGADLIAV